MPKQEAAKGSSGDLPNKQRPHFLLPLPSPPACYTHCLCKLWPKWPSTPCGCKSYAAQTDDNNINRKCWHIKNKSMPLCLYQLGPKQSPSLLARPTLPCPRLVSTIPCTCCRVEVIKKICPFHRLSNNARTTVCYYSVRSLSLSFCLSISLSICLSFPLFLLLLALCLTLDEA